MIYFIFIQYWNITFYFVLWTTDFSFVLLLLLFVCVSVQKYYLDVVTNIHNKLSKHKKIKPKLN